MCQCLRDTPTRCIQSVNGSFCTSIVVEWEINSIVELRGQEALPLLEFSFASRLRHLDKFLGQYLGHTEHTVQMGDSPCSLSLSLSN